MRRMKNNKSPEEKLLDVIEGPSGADGEMPKKRFGFKFGTGVFGFFNFGPRKIKLKQLNLILFVAAFVLTAIFAVFFVREQNSFGSRIEMFIKDNKRPSVIFLEGSEKKPSFDNYVNEIRQNNPFDLLIDDAVKSKKEEQVVYKLAGIIWSDNPQAILEEEATQKTYMVYKGDKLAGGYRVTDIASSEVIITGADGEEVLR